ncbi:MAG: DNA-binding response regulator [Planctomycetaceae bacterium]
MAQVLSICEDIATQKVLILLGSSSDGTIDRAVRAGVRGCMLASDSAGVLLEGIRAVAAGEYWFSETIRDRLVFDPSTRCYSVTAPNGVASLSKRQLQVLHHAAEGRTNREAAELMQISEKSIETHMYRMMQKLGVHNRVQLVRMAMREGVVAP